MHGKKPTFAELIADLDVVATVGDVHASVSDLVYDSRKVSDGAVFIAVRGLWVDGHGYIDAALAAGARAIIAETPPPDALPPGVAWAQVRGTDRGLGLAAAAFYRHPSHAMKVLAVTGTNGKTTVSTLLFEILEATGHRPGLVGTVEHRFAGQVRPTIFTTPPSADLHSLLAEMRDAGCTHVALEASSHGLVQHRLAGVRVEVGGFTNLSQDHLDYHKTMEAYRDAKAILFQRLARTACFNVDDPAGRAYSDDYAGRGLTLSVAGADADLSVAELSCTLDGSRARVAGTQGEFELRTPLVGRHNVENALVALGMALLAGVDRDAALAALAEARGARGRLEVVPGPRRAIVDYAHTPDALDNVLSALRPLTPGRLLCVFGAGGDRDPDKRPKMGRIVGEKADVAVVTSDNPRTEDPRAIVDQVVAGLPEGADVHVEVDRRAAIRWALAEAGPDDVVLIAGKGHEDYQILGTERVHFSDVEEAAAAMRPHERGR